MTYWPAVACRSCGVAPPRVDRFYQDPGHPEEVLCIFCYRWLRCWLAGLVSAADRQAFWSTRAPNGFSKSPLFD